MVQVLRPPKHLLLPLLTSKVSPSRLQVILRKLNLAGGQNFEEKYANHPAFVVEKVRRKVGSSTDSAECMQLPEINRL